MNVAIHSRPEGAVVRIPHFSYPSEMFKGMPQSSGLVKHPLVPITLLCRRFADNVAHHMVSCCAQAYQSGLRV